MCNGVGFTVGKNKEIFIEAYCVPSCIPEAWGLKVE
jgi:hypothetical protein